MYFYLAVRTFAAFALIAVVYAQTSADAVKPSVFEGKCLGKALLKDS